jgi:MarR family transcriptional repressor of mepA
MSIPKRVEADSLLDDATFFSLLAITQAGMWILNDLESQLREFGLSHGRLSMLLVALDDCNQPVHANRLASMLGKSKPTVSNMLARLQSDGLMESRTDDTDLRAKRLLLTDKGRLLLSQVIPVVNQRARQLAEGIGTDDKQALVRILSRLRFDNPDRTIRCSL